MTPANRAAHCDTYDEEDRLIAAIVHHHDEHPGDLPDPEEWDEAIRDEGTCLVCGEDSQIEDPDPVRRVIR